MIEAWSVEALSIDLWAGRPKPAPTRPTRREYGGFALPMTLNFPTVSFSTGRENGLASAREQWCLPMTSKRANLATRAAAGPEVAAWVQLARAFGRLHRHMELMLARHGLTGPQFDVLVTVQRSEGCTQQQLAGRLLMTKGNIAVVIENLETLKMIERRADPDDGRVKRVHLTSAARDRLAAIFPDHRAALKKAWAPLSADELLFLTLQLARVESGLGPAPPANAAAD